MAPIETMPYMDLQMGSWSGMFGLTNQERYEGVRGSIVPIAEHDGNLA